MWNIFLAQSQFDRGGDFSPISLICALILTIVVLAAVWRMFEKAGRPGWAAIIPIYNTIVLLDIAGKPWWWILLLLIPFVNFIIIILVMIDLARAFGQGVLFGIGLLLLSPIFFLILGFGPAEYVGSEKAKNY